MKIAIGNIKEASNNKLCRLNKYYLLSENPYLDFVLFYLQHFQNLLCAFSNDIRKGLRSCISTYNSQRNKYVRFLHTTCCPTRWRQFGNLYMQCKKHVNFATCSIKNCKESIINVNQPRKVLGISKKGKLLVKVR